jgi:peptidoglycan/LPS O-acetylase OafA/YrhL
MPAYWLHLLILFVFAYQLFSKTQADQLHSNQNFLYAFFYLSNWQRAMEGSDVTGLLSHTWSLAIEEQFYLLWAAILFLMLRHMKRKTIVLTTAVIIVLTALIRAFQWEGKSSVDFLYNAFNSRMDSLLVGCLVGQIIAWRMLPDFVIKSRHFDLLSITSLLTAVIIIFNLPDSYYSAFLYLGGLTIFSLAIGILIIWLVKNSDSRIHRILETRLMVWIGKTSYGLYLWHSATIAFVHLFPWPPIFKLLVAGCLTLTITAVSYYLLEQPFLKLKKRFT